MDAEIKNKLWQSEIKILDEIDRICKKHNIRYFLMWGTLIGAVRHKGFIPWDDDIDVSMIREDYKKFLKIAKSELGEEFFLQTGLTDKGHHLYFAKVRLNNTAFCEKKERNQLKHRGIFVDIIPIDRRKEKDSFIRKRKDVLAERTRKYIHLKREGLKLGKLAIFNLLPQSLVVKLRDWSMSGKGEYCKSFTKVFNYSDFFPTVNLTFEGKEYPAPREYDKILTISYGDYMKLPPENEQVTHQPEFISFDLKSDMDKYKEYLEKK